MRAHNKRITARPSQNFDDVATPEPTEEGLSLAPEEMGQSFLRYATEQGTRITGQAGDVDDFTNETEPPLLETDDESESESNLLEAPRGVAEIDLTESVIDEASLLDDESDVLGEVIPKEPRTEDGGRHKPRAR